jgi:hypothetical protein
LEGERWNKSDWCFTSTITKRPTIRLFIWNQSFLAPRIISIEWQKFICFVRSAIKDENFEPLHNLLGERETARATRYLAHIQSEDEIDRVRAILNRKGGDFWCLHWNWIWRIVIWFWAYICF